MTMRPPNRRFYSTKGIDVIRVAFVNPFESWPEYEKVIHSTRAQSLLAASFKLSERKEIR